MKKRKSFVSVLAILLVVIMVVSLLAGLIGPTSAYAVSQSEIDALQKQKDALKDKKTDLQSEINALRSEQASYLDQKAALDEQNELSRQEIEVLTEQITLYDEMIEQKGEELKEALAVEQEQYDRLRVRIRAMEEDGNLTYLDALFQANDFSELLSRMDMISEIMESDKRLEEEYIATRKEVQQIKADYEKAQADMEEKKADLEVEVAELEKQIAAATDMIASLEGDISVYTKAYNENAAAEQAIQSQIDGLVAELKRQEAAAAAAAAAQNRPAPTTGATGSFVWPVPSSTYITSRFGYRIHPIFGTQRYHAGVDISANSGATILAADAGTVSVATYSSSYGNYVLINHGNGNTTLYAHMSSMAVSAGQSVSKGQTIGYVGSTGWSTGPHCHFEVRSNGANVDPLSYFSSYTIAPSA